MSATTCPTRYNVTSIVCFVWQQVSLLWQLCQISWLILQQKDWCHVVWDSTTTQLTCSLHIPVWSCFTHCFTDINCNKLSRTLMHHCVCDKHNYVLMYEQTIGMTNTMLCLSKQYRTCWCRDVLTIVWPLTSREICLIVCGTDTMRYS